MFKYILFILNLFYNFKIIDSKELEYYNLNNILNVVEFINNYFFLVKIIIKHKELVKNANFIGFLKILYKNSIKFIIVSDKNLLLMFIYYLNEFKGFRISYKKDLLNYNPYTYFKGFKVNNLYMLNCYESLHYLDFKNSNDSKNHRLFFINKKLWNEFLEFKSNNGLFFLDFEKSYMNLDKGMLNTLKNYKQKEFDSFEVYKECINYYFKNSINLDSLFELEYYSNSKNNNYLKYLIDSFYNYSNIEFDSFNSFIVFVFDSLDLDLNSIESMDSICINPNIELIKTISNNSIKDLYLRTYTNKKFLRFVQMNEFKFYRLHGMIFKKQRNKETLTKSELQIKKILEFISFIVYSKDFKQIDLLMLESLINGIIPLKYKKEFIPFLKLVRTIFNKSKKETNSNLNDFNFKKNETIKKILR